MKMAAKLGNPFLILVWSLAMLLLGSAIGLHRQGSPKTACWLATLGDC